VSVPCKLCEKKRARRYCPGVTGEICPICCGTERENTIDCPLDCEHLQEARQHERPAAPGAGDIPNRDIRLSEQFLEDHEDELMWLTRALARAMETGKSVDLDAREALDALIRTYRTLESGLIYETRPQNPYAAAIQQSLRQSIEDLRERMAEESGMQRLRDADVLGTLVFLQRLEMQHNNGRRRGRAFFDFLRSYFPAPSPVSLES
jgi:archaellum component FlaC